MMNNNFPKQYVYCYRCDGSLCRDNFILKFTKFHIVRIHSKLYFHLKEGANAQ